MSSEESTNIELCRFKPGEVLFEAGEQSYHFFMIKEGQVEVYRESPDGQKVVLAVIEDGQPIGEFAMIDRQPRSASARAVGEVLAVKISETGYQELLSELPNWAQSMMEGLVSRLRKANEIIEMHASIDEQTRTDFHATEYNTDTAIEFDFDFSNITIDKNYTPEDD